MVKIGDRIKIIKKDSPLYGEVITVTALDKNIETKVLVNYHGSLLTFTESDFELPIKAAFEPIFKIHDRVLYHSIETGYYFDAKILDIDISKDKPYLLLVEDTANIWVYPVEVECKEPYKRPEPKFKIGEVLKYRNHICCIIDREYEIDNWVYYLKCLDKLDLDTYVSENILETTEKIDMRKEFLIPQRELSEKKIVSIIAAGILANPNLDQEYKSYLLNSKEHNITKESYVTKRAYKYAKSIIKYE